MHGRAVAALLALTLTFTGCKGADGAAGPAGPQGPEGPEGPSGAGDVTTFSGTVSTSDGVSRALPASYFAGGALPALSCYFSSDGVTWLAMQSNFIDGEPFACGLTRDSSGQWHAVMTPVPAGYQYMFVLVH